MRRTLCAALCLLLLGGILPAYGLEGDAPEEDAPVAASEPLETEEIQDEQPADSDTKDDGDKTDEPEQSAGSEQTDEPTVTDSPGEDEEQQTEQTVKLQIDSGNRYDGMEKSWQSGYTPTVSGGKVFLVLPLEADGPLQDDQLTAKLELGATENSPFAYKNYEKTVSLTQQAVNGTEQTKSVYYVRFDLPLASGRYNGVYPVTVEISARDGGGNAVSQSFTLYVTITDGKDPNETTEEPQTVETEPPAPTSNPIILVSGSALTPAEVSAGEAFAAAITLRNTSDRKAVQNMVVTVGYDTGHFTLLEDSDTIFLSRLGKGETAELTLHFAAGLNTPEGVYPLQLSFSYDDPDAVTLSSTGTVLVPVKQPLRLELTMPRIASSVNAGDTIPLSFQVMNLGRGKVYNVRCEVSGDGLLPTGAAFVGDMEPGTEGSADLNLFIGTKDMSEDYQGTEQYGRTTGTVTLIYEDGDGTEYTEEQTFFTDIEKPVVAAVTKEQEEEPGPALQWQVSVLVGGLILVLGALVVLLRLRRRHEAG